MNTLLKLAQEVVYLLFSNTCDKIISQRKSDYLEVYKGEEFRFAITFVSLVSWAWTERTDSHPFPHPSKLHLSFPCLDRYPQCPFSDIPILQFPTAMILSFNDHIFLLRVHLSYVFISWSYTLS